MHLFRFSLGYYGTKLLHISYLLADLIRYNVLACSVMLQCNVRLTFIDIKEIYYIIIYLHFIHYMLNIEDKIQIVTRL